MACSFPKGLRLRKRHEFLALRREESLRVNHGGLLFLFKPNGLGRTRLGVTITRKAWPLATRRNKWRRLLREVFRQSQEVIPQGWDLVVVVTKKANEPSLKQIKEAMLWAMRRVTRKPA